MLESVQVSGDTRTGDCSGHTSDTSARRADSGFPCAALRSVAPGSHFPHVTCLPFAFAAGDSFVLRCDFFPFCELSSDRQKNPVCCWRGSWCIRAHCCQSLAACPAALAARLFCRALCSAVSLTCQSPPCCCHLPRVVLVSGDRSCK